MRNEISTAARVPIPFTCIPDLLEAGRALALPATDAAVLSTSGFTAVSSTRDRGQAVRVGAYYVVYAPVQRLRGSRGVKQACARVDRAESGAAVGRGNYSDGRAGDHAHLGVIDEKWAMYE
jgi:hypothetical protein